MEKCGCDYESDWCSACVICNPHSISEVIPVVFENHHIIVGVQGDNTYPI